MSESNNEENESNKESVNLNMEEEDNENNIKSSNLYDSKKIDSKEESNDNKNLNIVYIDGKEDPNDTSYDSVKDPNPVIIFDSEIQFRKDIDEVDIIFIVDTTGSMNPYIKSIKRFIRKFLFDAEKALYQFKTESINMLKYGLISYRDHDQENESHVSEIICELTDDKSEFRKGLYSLNAKGGKDECEAVLDGLDLGVNGINWRDKSMKFIYHICGSPSHGSEYNGGIDDDYSEGCPCGKKGKDVLEDLRGKGIEYTCVTFVNHNLDTMIKAFSKYCKIDIMNKDFEKEDVDDSQ